MRVPAVLLSLFIVLSGCLDAETTQGDTDPVVDPVPEPDAPASKEFEGVATGTGVYACSGESTPGLTNEVGWTNVNLRRPAGTNGTVTVTWDAVNPTADRLQVAVAPGVDTADVFLFPPATSPMTVVLDDESLAEVGNSFVLRVYVAEDCETDPGAGARVAPGSADMEQAFEGVVVWA